MFLSDRGTPKVAQRTLSSKTDYKLFLINGRISQALTSFHRFRRCMVFHQNADVSESASYLPARKRGKKKHTNNEKIFLKVPKFKRKTDSLSQVPVQLSQGRLPTHNSKAACARRSGTSPSPTPRSGLAQQPAEHRCVSILCLPHVGPWPVPPQACTVLLPSAMGPAPCGGYSGGLYLNRPCCALFGVFNLDHLCASVP